MNKLIPLLITISLISFADSAAKDMATYCDALAGELAACKTYLTACEAQKREFLMRSQDREKTLSKENAKLKQELQKLLEQKQKLLEEKKRLTEERQALIQKRQACEQPLAQAENSLESLKSQLPKHLAETLLPPLKSDDLSARLRRFLDSLDAIREFDHQASPPIPHVLEGPDGIRREYQILYYGLSLAYAVCLDAKSAGMGIRQGTEWRWQWNSEWHPAISKALDIRLGKRPPELIHLPLPPINGEKEER